MKKLLIMIPISLVMLTLVYGWLSNFLISLHFMFPGAGAATVILSTVMIGCCIYVTHRDEF